MGGAAAVVYYRVLDYYFSVECDVAAIADYIHHVLGAFETEPDDRFERTPPTANEPPRYTFVTSTDDVGQLHVTVVVGSETLIYELTAASAVDYFFWHVNTESMRRSGSYFLVHSGAVRAPSGEGILLPGTGGSGKSTLVAALVRAGFGYLSDEAAAIDPVSGDVCPFPKALTLKSGSFDVFPDLRPPESRPITDHWHLPPDALRPGSQAEATTVRLIFFVTYRPGDTELSPLSTAEAVKELWSNSLSTAIYGRRSLTVLGRLARGADAYVLRYANLADAIDVIEGEVAALTAESA